MDEHVARCGFDRDCAARPPAGRGDERRDIDPSLLVRFGYDEETAIGFTGLVQVEPEVDAALGHCAAFEAAVLVPGERCAPLWQLDDDRLGEGHQTVAVEIASGTQQTRVTVRAQDDIRVQERSADAVEYLGAVAIAEGEVSRMGDRTAGGVRVGTARNGCVCDESVDLLAQCGDFSGRDKIAQGDVAVGAVVVELVWR